MQIDNPSRAPMPPADPYRDPRDENPGSQQWDMGINRNLNRLDIHGTPPTDAASSWASEANRAVQAQAEQARAQPITQVRFEESPYSARAQHNIYQHQSAPPVTPREAKRQAWYHGPVSFPNPPIDPRLQRTSPEDSSSSEGVPGTPSSATVHDLNPSIMHSNGYVESRNGNGFPVPENRIVPSNAPNGYPTYQPREGQDYTYSHGQPATAAQGQHGVPKGRDATGDMLRLEALVAVATSEENVAAAAY